ncbi:MAG: hypothetical protein ACLRSY_07510 [Acutalibacter sp.]
MRKRFPRSSRENYTPLRQHLMGYMAQKHVGTGRRHHITSGASR